MVKRKHSKAIHWGPRQKVRLGIIVGVIMLVGSAAAYYLNNYYLQAAGDLTLVNHAIVNYCTDGDSQTVCNPNSQLFSGTTVTNSVTTEVDFIEPDPEPVGPVVIKVNLYGRGQNQQDSSLVKVDILNSSTKAPLVQLTATSSTNGVITLPETPEMNAIVDESLYIVRVKARGFVGRSVRVSNVRSQQIIMPLAPVGDFNEDKKVDLVDLAKASSVYSGRNAPDAVFQEVYKYNPKPGIPHLADLARLIAYGYKHVDEE